MGRRKFFGILFLLSLLLLVPAVLSLGGILNLSNLPLFSNGVESSSSTTSSSPIVFVNPTKVIDETLQPPDSTFTVHVNISDVTDLFAWQINMTFNPSILNVNEIIVGEFLFRTDSENKTSSASSYYGGLGCVMNVTDNADGYIVMTESILEDAVPGSVPGISTSLGTSGRLVSVEFLVVGYGCTWLNMSLTSDFRTTLLDSNVPPNEISVPPENVLNGYFRNKVPGDADGDTHVNSMDILMIKEHWYGPSPPYGPSGYERNADLDDDGSINSMDVLIVKDYWEF